ncbi:MAG: hypothetical protein ACQETD_00560 [Pseudomonadota bacterium]
MSGRALSPLSVVLLAGTLLWAGSAPPLQAQGHGERPWGRVESPRTMSKPSRDSGQARRYNPWAQMRELVGEGDGDGDQAQESRPRFAPKRDFGSLERAEPRPYRSRGAWQGERQYGGYRSPLPGGVPYGGGYPPPAAYWGDPYRPMLPAGGAFPGAVGHW